MILYLILASSGPDGAGAGGLEEDGLVEEDWSGESEERSSSSVSSSLKRDVRGACGREVHHRRRRKAEKESGEEEY